MAIVLCSLAGIYTGSIYDDIDLKKNGFPGEGVHNSSVVVKIHGFRLDNRAILILRNPRDSALAQFHQWKAGHIGLINQTYFENPGMDIFVCKTISHQLSKQTCILTTSATILINCNYYIHVL